ncbi:MAG TPA: tetratricopeptide repeat protein [Candidatus Limnocylindrales bacterium]|nr:tetratricopeptide repeat protein [Candidatus Limnocylindrales bacterium]
MDRIAQLQELLKTDPNDDFLYYGLGLEYLKAERYQEAVEAFKTVIKLKPDYSAAYRELGKALTKVGQLEEAKKVYQEGMMVAEKKGDLQTKKEMRVFLNRLLKP